jgi:hypothetical protein
MYPHVYQSGKSGNTLSAFGTRYALPMGTVRDEHKDYEEITIPVSKQAPIRIGEKRIRIDEMDPLCSGAFKVCDHPPCMLVSAHFMLNFVRYCVLGIRNAQSHSIHRLPNCLWNK